MTINRINAFSLVNKTINEFSHEFEISFQIRRFAPDVLSSSYFEIYDK